MKITKATIVVGDCGVRVTLHTDLPSPFPKITEQNLTLKFDCEFGTAEQYLSKNFPQVPIKVIKLR